MYLHYLEQFHFEIVYKTMCPVTNQTSTQAGIRCAAAEQFYFFKVKLL